MSSRSGEASCEVLYSVYLYGVIRWVAAVTLGIFLFFNLSAVKWKITLRFSYFFSVVIDGTTKVTVRTRTVETSVQFSSADVR